jgi:aminopeptidase
VPEARLQRLADLAVSLGANVQTGQIVFVTAYVGQEEAARAVTESAYRRGAKFVDVWYFDPWVKRERIEHAADETLDFVPSWYGDRMRALGDQRCARISFTGPVAPGLLGDLDPSRVGKDQLPYLKETNRIVNDRTTNWNGCPYPSPPWARLVFPELDEDAALERLWEEVGRTLRLDEPDPARAWLDRMDVLNRSAARLTERRFDAIQLEGPGTDLTVGLFPSSRWWAADFSTVDGIRHFPNLPTEEVFTTPDPARTEGHVAATRPLVLRDGTIIEGIRVRFEKGVAVEIDADRNAEALRSRCALDEGASRLGEIALVDREGRIGPLGTVFFDTLLDENAASHIAFGGGFAFLVDESDAPRVNTSAVHLDFMIGSNDLDVTGVTADRERVPVLRDGSWQI